MLLGPDQAALTAQHVQRGALCLPPGLQRPEEVLGTQEAGITDGFGKGFAGMTPTREGVHTP